MKIKESKLLFGLTCVLKENYKYVQNQYLEFYFSRLPLILS
jgi:hypothetical protein